MDGLAWLGHIRSVLQGGRAALDYEAKLALPQAGVALDAEYLALRFEESLHGEAYLDCAPLCCVYYGEIILS